jgi:predicted dehydrogenase
MTRNEERGTKKEELGIVVTDTPHTPDIPRRVKIGLIGTGLAVEKLHWPALRQLADRFDVVAFADASRENGEAFASYADVSMERYAADYRDLLRRDDVEAVLVALPIPLLYPATRDALEAGKHVISEKPPGADLSQAREFLRLPELFPGHVLLVAENFFYRDDLRLARSLLDGGAIGRLHLMAWHTAFHSTPQPGQFSSTPWRWQPQYRGGPLLDAGVHFIAQIRLLCGDATHLHAEVLDANPTMGGPSDLTLNLRFADGAIGSHSAVHSPIPVPREGSAMRLYGSDGTMLVGGAGGGGQGARRIEIHRSDGSAETYRIEGGGNGYANEWRNFYDAIVYGEPVAGTVAQSFQNLLIVMRALDSAEGGLVAGLYDAPGGVSAQGVPLWRPRGATGLFDGLPCRVITEAAPSPAATGPG